MKKLLGLGILVLFFGFSASAQASIFLDFDRPDFLPDTTAGDQAHTYSIGSKNIDFNGRIWHGIESDTYAGHTGLRNFLKNTEEQKKVTLSFDFNVNAIDFYWLGVSGASMHGAVYGPQGGTLDSGEEEGAGEWEYVFVNPDRPIRSISFWTGTGNRMAIDDLTLYLANDALPSTVTPEPASMALFGLGLAGIVRLRRRV
jgi:hypothetical protein